MAKNKKNIVQNITLDAAGDISIGDNQNTTQECFEEKNVVRESEIRAGGNFRLGDDITGKPINTSLHRGQAKNSELMAMSADTILDIETLHVLIAAGETGEAISRLLQYTEMYAVEWRNEMLQLSERWQTLARKKRRRTVDPTQADVEHNQIVSGLLELITLLEGHYPNRTT